MTWAEAILYFASLLSIGMILRMFYATGVILRDCFVFVCLFALAIAIKRSDRYLEDHGRRRKWTPLHSYDIICSNRYRLRHLQYLSHGAAKMQSQCKTIVWNWIFITRQLLLYGVFSPNHVYIKSCGISFVHYPRLRVKSCWNVAYSKALIGICSGGGHVLSLDILAITNS